MTDSKTKSVEPGIRKIIHIDMDAFYASVEQRDNPSLQGKPVIVGGSPDSRGVVSAASYEARAFGVHSAMPTVRAIKLCPAAVLLKPRMSHYVAVSRQLMEIYRGYTDLIEPLSLDECFLDVTENKKDIPYASDLARELKVVIRSELDLTASAGVAPNKFLAKVASDLQKPDGLVVVKPHMVKAFLKDLPVEKIWGVGRVTAERIHQLGISTIGQLAKEPEEKLVASFGKAGSFFHRLAKGEDDRPVQPHLKRKSVSQERTFSRDVADTTRLVETLQLLSEKVSGILIRKELKGSTVTLKLRYSDFTTITRSHTHPFPLSGTREILDTGLELLDKTEAGIRPVRLIGIGVSNLINTADIKQLALFDPLRMDKE